MDQPPLGNKAPRLGYARQIWCPGCRGLLENPLALMSGHVLLEWIVIEGTCVKAVVSVLYNLPRYTHTWGDQSIHWQVFQSWKEWDICPPPVRQWHGCSGDQNSSWTSQKTRNKPCKTHWYMAKHMGRGGGGGDCGFTSMAWSVNCKLHYFMH